VPNFLTETAFDIPGTKVGVPRWALFGGGIALVVILVMLRQNGPAAAEAGTEEEADTSGGGLTGLEDLINELNAPPDDFVEPGKVGGKTHYQSIDLSTDPYVTSQMAVTPGRLDVLLPVAPGVWARPAGASDGSSGANTPGKSLAQEVKTSPTKNIFTGEEKGTKITLAQTVGVKPTVNLFTGKTTPKTASSQIGH